MNRVFCMLRCLGLLLGLLVLGGAAEAGRLDFTKGPDTPCTYTYTGLVEKGDLALFEALEGKDALLCLHSPGGSFLEAVKIFHVLHAQNIATRVRAHHACDSACALIWLAGSSVFEDSVHGDFVSVDRSTEPGAILRFHAPYVREDVLRKNEAAALAAFVVAREAVLEVFRIARIERDNGSYNPMNTYLFEQMMAATDGKWFHIYTVQDAIFANVRIARQGAGGYDTQTDLSQRMMHLCQAAVIGSKETFELLIRRLAPDRAVRSSDVMRWFRNQTRMQDVRTRFGAISNPVVKRISGAHPDHTAAHETTPGAFCFPLPAAYGGEHVGKPFACILDPTDEHADFVRDPERLRALLHKNWEGGWLDKQVRLLFAPHTCFESASSNDVLVPMQPCEPYQIRIPLVAMNGRYFTLSPRVTPDSVWPHR